MNQLTILIINIYIKAKKQDSPKIKFTDSVHLHDKLSIYNQIIILISEFSTVHWEILK